MKAGPLERYVMRTHCEMCGAHPPGTIDGRYSAARLEAAYDPNGQPKTLCYDCRIESAEILAEHRLSQGPYLKLSSRELATVLAALRYWQSDVLDSGDEDRQAKAVMPEHFEDDKPLSSEDVDELCERLNFSAKHPDA